MLPLTTGVGMAHRGLDAIAGSGAIEEYLPRS
jgi:hypothetical protein